MFFIYNFITQSTHLIFIFVGYHLEGCVEAQAQVGDDLLLHLQDAGNHILNAYFPRFLFFILHFNMPLIAYWKNKCFLLVHLLDELVVLLEDLQLVVGVVALQYVDLHAHAQDHSHLAGNFITFNISVLFNDSFFFVHNNILIEA